MCMGEVACQLIQFLCLRTTLNELDQRNVLLSSIPRPYLCVDHVHEILDTATFHREENRSIARRVDDRAPALFHQSIENGTLRLNHS